MDHKEIDKLLTKLPCIMKESYPFLSFSGDMRKNVHKRTSEQIQMHFEEKDSRLRFIMTGAAVFITFFLLGSITPFFIKGDRQQVAETPLITQIESKIIDLDGEGTPEMVNTWKINGAEMEEELIALIWARDRKGDWQIVSSEPMIGGEFLPLEVLKPDKHKGHLVVIAAERENENVSYRVVGYNGQEVLPFLERSLEYSTNRGSMIQEIESLLPVTLEK